MQNSIFILWFFTIMTTTKFRDLTCTVFNDKIQVLVEETQFYCIASLVKMESEKSEVIGTLNNPKFYTKHNLKYVLH